MQLILMLNLNVEYSLNKKDNLHNAQTGAADEECDARDDAGSSAAKYKKINKF